MINKNSKLRIIGGDYKGRTLTFISTKNLRPTGHRIKETLFNWLMKDIEGSKCLDLFAGTGSLGIEALSRKAEYVSFIEKDKNIFIKLNDNINLLNLTDRSKTHLANGLSWLTSNTNKKLNFNIIFIDPPFGLGLIEKVYLIMQKKKILKKGCLIYIEAEKEINLKKICAEWKEIKQANSNRTSYSLFVS